MDISSLPSSTGIAHDNSLENVKILSEIDTNNPQSSKQSLMDENRFFDTNSADRTSKTSTKEHSNEKASSEVNAAVTNALSLLYQLKDAVKLIQNLEVETCPTTSLEDNRANELELLRRENNEIEQDLQNKQEQLIQLSSQYEEATELLKEKTEECAKLKASLQQSLSSVEESQTDVSLSTIGGSFSTLPVSSSEISISEISNQTDLSHYAPQSLPAFNTTKVNEEELQQKLCNLQKEVQSYQFKIKRLADMNAQWEQYNGEKEIIVTRLEEDVKEKQIEIDHLKRQIDAANTDSKSVTFSPAQQAFIDNAYQRLRLEADRYRDKQDATALEARRVVAQAKQKQEETEKKSVELQQRIAELEGRARAQTQRQEELQTALLVATRSSQQTSREQELISSLREAARQYENDYRRISEDHRNTLRDNNLLKDELARLRQRGNVQQTIVTQHPGGTTTMTRSGGQYSIRNESRSSPGGDIEIDEYNRF